MEEDKYRINIENLKEKYPNLNLDKLKPRQLLKLQRGGMSSKAYLRRNKSILRNLLWERNVICVINQLAK